MQLIPLKDLSDDHEFWHGNIFRQFNVGLNVEDKSQDYYDYMLADIPGNYEYMLLTNVTRDAGKYKAGLALAMVKIILGSRRVVHASAIKNSMGTKDVYWIKED